MSKQSDLVPDTTMYGRALELDFPSLHIGVAQYAEGPTGATVFRFAKKAVGCVDVRGGAPGTYNTNWLKLGYSNPNLDAVIVSGGSWYGLAAAGGAAAALKEDGARSGHWSNLANVAGAIVYDLGERRTNDIIPDEALGAAAMRAAKPGRFPLGAARAGRMTMQGSISASGCIRDNGPRLGRSAMSRSRASWSPIPLARSLTATASSIAAINGFRPARPMCAS